MGVKVTESGMLPGVDITVPNAGLYTNVPGTLAVAFNCEELSAVPTVTLDGVGQLRVGVAWVTVSITDPEAAL